MFEESHRGHLKFSWAEEGVELVAEVVVADVVEEEGDGEGEREGEGEGVPSKMVALMGIFLSPPIKPAPPKSSWIIFSSL